MKKSFNYFVILTTLLLALITTLYFLNNEVENINNPKENTFKLTNNNRYIEEVKKLQFSDAFGKYNYSGVYDYQTSQSINNSFAVTNEKYANSIAGIGGKTIWSVKDKGVNENTVYVTCKCFDNNENNNATIDFLYDYNLSIAEVYNFLVGDVFVIEKGKINLKNAFEIAKLELARSLNKTNEIFENTNNTEENTDDYYNQLNNDENIEDEINTEEYEQDEYIAESSIVVENTKNESVKKVDPLALFDGSSKNVKTDTIKENNTLEQKTDKESKKNNITLKGRKAKTLPKPIYRSREQGIVVVKILVNRNGDVIDAFPGVRGSTTMARSLLDSAKEAALKTKFDVKKDAPEKQIGTITYHFTLR